MELDSRIYVAGHRGLVGSAIVRKLKDLGYTKIIVDRHEDLDLRHQQWTRNFISLHEPDYVFLAAAKVGGINYNKSHPADFIYDNLSIQNNVINSSYKLGVKKLLFLGSSCIYPKVCDQPIKESALLTSPLEPTNEAYAIAKIAGIESTANSKSVNSITPTTTKRGVATLIPFSMVKNLSLSNSLLTLKNL